MTASAIIKSIAMINILHLTGLQAAEPVNLVPRGVLVIQGFMNEIVVPMKTTKGFHKWKVPYAKESPFYVTCNKAMKCWITLGVSDDLCEFFQMPEENQTVTVSCRSETDDVEQIKLTKVKHDELGTLCLPAPGVIKNFSQMRISKEPTASLAECASNMYKIEDSSVAASWVPNMDNNGGKCYYYYPIVGKPMELHRNEEGLLAMVQYSCILGCNSYSSEGEDDKEFNADPMLNDPCCQVDEFGNMLDSCTMNSPSTYSADERLDTVICVLPKASKRQRLMRKIFVDNTLSDLVLSSDDKASPLATNAGVSNKFDTVNNSGHGYNPTMSGAWMPHYGAEGEKKKSDNSKVLKIAVSVGGVAGVMCISSLVGYYFYKRKQQQEDKTTSIVVLNKDFDVEE